MTEIYKITHYSKPISKAILVEGRRMSLQVAQEFLKDDGRTWVDRGAELYGNRNIEPTEWDVRKWVLEDDRSVFITIEPVKVFRREVDGYGAPVALLSHRS